MKKKTKKEKVQQSDEERIVYFHRSIRKWARKLVALRSGYQYFIENKGWILSLLFVLSIVRASIWYGLFGVNILAYSSLQDLFMSFADYFMSIIMIGILLICFYLFYPQNINKKRKKITLAVVIISFIAILWIVLSLFRMIFPILSLILIFLTLFTFLASKMKIAFLWFSLFLLLGLSLLQPFEQYLYSRGDGSIITSFVERSAHYDYISFDYNNTHIDTKTNTYYLIGCNSSYYFIFDKEAQETLIIPKSECKNIKSRPFGLNSLLFLKP